MTNDDQEHAEADAVFDAAWDVCADNGECDQRGGLEYFRCRLAWEKRGRMDAALAWIKSEANKPPGQNP